MTKTFATAISLFAFLSIAQGKPSRRLQESPTCDITGFSLYNGEYVTSLYYTLDLNDYPNGEISLIADTSGEGCKCIKLSFACSTTEDPVPPYSLYGDINGSFLTGSPGGNDTTTETLEAWAYTDEACSVQSGYMSIEDILIIPTTVPKQNIITATPITVVYESTTGPVTDAETDEAIASTCDYFEEALGYGMV